MGVRKPELKSFKLKFSAVAGSDDGQTNVYTASIDKDKLEDLVTGDYFVFQGLKFVEDSEISIHELWAGGDKSMRLFQCIRAFLTTANGGSDIALDEFNAIHGVPSVGGGVFSETYMRRQGFRLTAKIANANVAAKDVVVNVLYSNSPIQLFGTGVTNSRAAQVSDQYATVGPQYHGGPYLPRAGFHPVAPGSQGPLIQSAAHSPFGNAIQGPWTAGPI